MADDCIDIVAKSSGITEDEAIEILDDLRRERMRSHGNDAGLAQAAIDKGIEQKLKAAMHKKQVALSVIARSKLEPHINGLVKDGLTTGQAIEAVLYSNEKHFKGGRVSANSRYKGIVGEWISEGITARIAKEMPHIYKMLKDKRFLDDITRELHEIKPNGKRGITGNTDAKWAADLFAEYMEISRLRLNRAGANIGKLQGRSPQSHNPSKILREGFESWFEKILPRIDRNRSFFGLDNSEIKDAMLDIYTTITTGITKDLETSPFTTGRRISKQLEEHREIHFKSADDQISYQNEFGQGNLFRAMLGQLDTAARKAAMMETFGPNPEATISATIDAYKLKIRNSDLSDILKNKQLKSLKGNLKQRKGAIGRAYSVTSGDANIPHNLTGAQIGTALRAWQSTTKLGKAALSSMNDVLTFAMNMRFQGKNIFESYLDAFSTVFAGKTSAEQKEIAYLLGATFDGIIGDVVNRFDYQDTFNGTAGAITDKFFRASGLTWWTNRLKAGFARKTSAYMAKQAGKAFDGLKNTYRSFLEMHGINAREWDVIRSAAKKQADGRTYVLPEDVGRVTKKSIDKYIAPEVAELRKLKGLGSEEIAKRIDDLRANARQDLKTKLMSLYADEIDHAVITPQDRTRATLTRGFEPGTWEGEIARFVTQFKSFPIAFGQMILGGKRYKQAGRTGFDPVGSANIIAGSLLFGYAAMTAKDIVLGRSPRDPNKIETWYQAAVQGGGAGIYGDLLFHKTNRYGGGIVETLAGPMAGTAAEGVRMVNDALRGEFKGSAAFWAATNNTPFLNLWYSRAAIDYLIGYHIQEWLNPGTLRRREKKLKKEWGQEYYLPPSSVIKRGGGFK